METSIYVDLEEDVEEPIYIDIEKAKEQTGEQQGGKHVARVQTGYEKDGSPAYRYFKTSKEYRDFLLKQSKKKREGKKDKKKGRTNQKKKGRGQRAVNSPGQKLRSKLLKESISTHAKRKKGPTHGSMGFNKSNEEYDFLYIGEDYE